MATEADPTPTKSAISPAMVAINAGAGVAGALTALFLQGDTGEPGRVQQGLCNCNPPAPFGWGESHCPLCGAYDSTPPPECGWCGNCGDCGYGQHKLP